MSPLHVRKSSKLKTLGMQNPQLFINGIFDALVSSDELATKIEAMGDEHLKCIPYNFESRTLKTFPLLP
jgi:hypothetical protein